MTETEISPEDRILIFVGGRMSPDALGPAYQQILDAIDRDPGAHMDAFERLFLTGKPNRHVVTDAFLVPFLRRVQPRLPDRVRSAAQRLKAQMDSLARRQAGEAADVETVRGEAEIARQRRQLERRREDLDRLVRGR
jgi:hypothetical protein